MSLDKLKEAKKITIGTKQTSKVIQKEKALLVYIAKDAEPHVINPLIELSESKGIEVFYIDTMAQLGEACGIEVGSASAAIVID